MKATQYQEAAKIQSQITHWCAEWLTNHINTDQDNDKTNAIEYGAGTGLLTQYLTPLHGKQLIASDISPEMVRLGQQNVTGCQWREIDAWKPELDFTPSYLYSSSLLQWTDNPKKTLQQWQYHAAPNARLLAAVFIKGSMSEWNQCLAEDKRFTWLETKDWLDALNQTGWQLIRHEEFNNTLYYPNALSAMHSWHDIGATNSGKSLSLSELRQSIKAYQNQFQTDAGIPCSWKALKFECIANSSSE